jgi:hypothetical protein
LKIGDGIHTANIALLGNYMASTFAITSDGDGGTLIAEAPHAQQGFVDYAVRMTGAGGSALSW